MNPTFILRQNELHQQQQFVNRFSNPMFPTSPPPNNSSNSSAAAILLNGIGQALPAQTLAFPNNIPTRPSSLSTSAATPPPNSWANLPTRPHANSATTPSTAMNLPGQPSGRFVSTGVMGAPIKEEVETRGRGGSTGNGALSTSSSASSSPIMFGKGAKGGDVSPAPGPYTSLKLRRKLRKNTREKQRRSELNDKFDRLCDILALNSGHGKVEKYTILTEAIALIERLRKETMDLRHEKAELRAELTKLTSCLHTAWQGPLSPNSSQQGGLNLFNTSSDVELLRQINARMFPGAAGGPNNLTSPKGSPLHLVSTPSGGYSGPLISPSHHHALSPSNAPQLQLPTFTGGMNGNNSAMEAISVTPSSAFSFNNNTNNSNANMMNIQNPNSNNNSQNNNNNNNNTSTNNSPNPNNMNLSQPPPRHQRAPSLTRVSSASGSQNGTPHSHRRGLSGMNSAQINSPFPPNPSNNNNSNNSNPNNLSVPRASLIGNGSILNSPSSGGSSGNMAMSPKSLGMNPLNPTDSLLFPRQSPRTSLIGSLGGSLSSPSAFHPHHSPSHSLTHFPFSSPIMSPPPSSSSSTSTSSVLSTPPQHSRDNGNFSFHHRKASSGTINFSSAGGVHHAHTNSGINAFNPLSTLPQLDELGTLGPLPSLDHVNGTSNSNNPHSSSSNNSSHLNGNSSMNMNHSHSNNNNSQNPDLFSFQSVAMDDEINLEFS